MAAPDDPAPDGPAAADAGPEAAFDPFAAHRRFAEAVRGGQLRTMRDRTGVTARAPLDTRADRLVDLDALAALAAWHGVIRPARPMRDEDYPQEVADALTEREPQFILRNIPRAERFADPDERPELTRSPVAYGLEVAGEVAGAPPRLERPALLEERGVDAVREQQAWTRRLRHGFAWERHFSRELKETLDIPLWRYDPDAPPEAAGGRGD